MKVKDQPAWVYASPGVSLDESTPGRSIKTLGFAKLWVRPCYREQDSTASAALKKPVRCCEHDPSGLAA
ncbi:hypothetical protein ASF60_19000 [Methylobacterium sp. Leaf113]|nr:hypothetical protein ASF60_19000 [Methylobacterium sp. Leaf113]